MTRCDIVSIEYSEPYIIVKKEGSTHNRIPYYSRFADEANSYKAVDMLLSAYPGTRLVVYESLLLYYPNGMVNGVLSDVYVKSIAEIPVKHRIACSAYECQVEYYLDKTQAEIEFARAINARCGV